MKVALRPIVAEIEAVKRDAWTAGRRLARTPGFAIMAVLSLGLGIGIPTAVYSVVHGILWASFGVRDPSDVIVVERLVNAGERAWNNAVSYADVLAIEQRTTSFQAVGASSNTVHIAEVVHGHVVSAQGEIVAGRYFSAVGVRPLLGTLNLSYDSRVSPRVVVSESFWRRALSANPGVVGTTIALDGQSREIVGVAPKEFSGFNGVGPATDVWTQYPAAAGVTRGSPLEPGFLPMTAIGRLAPGVSLAAATAELARLGADLDRLNPLQTFRAGPPMVRGWTPRPVATISRGSEAVSRYGVAIVGTMVLVMLVACSNLANLFLARAAVAKRELMLRRALGASWLSLMREQVFAGVLLAAAGCISGLLLTYCLLRMWSVDISLAPGRVTSMAPAVGTSGVFFAVIAAGVGVLLLSVIPALHIVRRASPLSASGSAFTPPNVHGAFIRLQVAISVCLFLVATACIRYVATAAGRDPGVAISRLALATVDFGPNAQALSDLNGLLQVAATRSAFGVSVPASWLSGLPFGVPAPAAQLIPDGSMPRSTDWNYVIVAGTSELFEALGIPVVAGRRFAPSGDERSIVLSVTAARDLFGAESPLGRNVLMTTPGGKPQSRAVVGWLAIQTSFASAHETVPSRTCLWIRRCQGD